MEIQRMCCLSVGMGNRSACCMKIYNIRYLQESEGMSLDGPL